MSDIQNRIFVLQGVQPEPLAKGHDRQIKAFQINPVPSWQLQGQQVESPEDNRLPASEANMRGERETTGYEPFDLDARLDSISVFHSSGKENRAYRGSASA